MPTERIAMHRIKELLRLKYECALSFERIARALKVSKGVVAKYVKAAEVSGLGWPTLQALDDEVIFPHWADAKTVCGASYPRRRRPLCIAGGERRGG